MHCTKSQLVVPTPPTPGPKLRKSPRQVRLAKWNMIVAQMKNCTPEWNTRGTHQKRFDLLPTTKIPSPIAISQLHTSSFSPLSICNNNQQPMTEPATPPVTWQLLHQLPPVSIASLQQSTAILYMPKFSSDIKIYTTHSFQQCPNLLAIPRLIQIVPEFNRV
jgi:hypothetical protein